MFDKILNKIDKQLNRMQNTDKNKNEFLAKIEKEFFTEWYKEIGGNKEEVYKAFRLVLFKLYCMRGINKKNILERIKERKKR